MLFIIEYSFKLSSIALIKSVSSLIIKISFSFEFDKFDKIFFKLLIWHIYKKKFENLKAVFSSSGPISITRLEREKEKGTGKSKDFKAIHNIIRKINNHKAIYCSPGHVENFLNINVKDEKKIKNFLFKHQIKKKFIFAFEWEKNSLAIWDNRSMLHQATPFNGNRIMHRITIK